MAAKYIACVLGLTWFDKLNGNTYHNSIVKVIDKESDAITTFKSGFKYGYDNMYLESAKDVLIKNNFNLKDVLIVNLGTKATLKTYCKDGIV